MSMSLRLQRAWYARSAWLLLLFPLLVPLEWLFRAAVALRFKLYLWRMLPVYSAPVPVVVVGNLTIGGSGKTPAVIALADALAGRGIRVGVVSRGYGSAGVNYPYRVSESSTAAQAGDEPLLIFERTSAAVVVHPKRTQAVQALLNADEVDLIISDDGLQHYAMDRDFEIVLYDESAGFGNGRCLPAGPLREPLARLKTVDEVLARSAVASQASLAIVAVSFVNINTGEERALNEHGFGNTISAVAGVALPELFFEQLGRLGLDVHRLPFPDHHRYTRKDFAELGSQPVIMTEKDAVKCRELALENAWYLKINAQLPEHVIERVAALVSVDANENGTAKATVNATVDGAVDASVNRGTS
ncbi:MAG: tetraacyldisaccharide 4'-kinase [Halioglobus sp.]